jgi:hypothetical protein
MKRVTVVSLLLALAALLAFPLAAEAHKPLWGPSSIASRDAALPISDPEISWAAYRELKQPGQVDYYTFNAAQGTKLYAQITIPRINGLENLNPTYALVGPGLPAPTAKLPFKLKPAEGAVIVRYTGSLPGQVFDEEFTQTQYWIHQEYSTTAPQAGTYYIAVWDETGQIGKYVLAIGEKEEFGLEDGLKFLVTWWEVKTYFGGMFYWYFFGVVAAFLALVAGIIARRRNVRTRGKA